MTENDASRRVARGYFNQIFTDTARDNVDEFENLMGMPISAFCSLLHKIEPLIAREDTQLRECIPASMRLEATLRFLVAGGSYTTLQALTKISKPSFCSLIPETCDAIYRVLKDDYMQMPTTPEEWIRVSNGFESRWQFPHCVGSIDGKHIIIKPPKEKSYYSNYKGTHSIVVMAVVNANYEFVHVDVGTNGRVSEGGIWSNSILCSKLERGKLGLPADRQMPDGRRLPFVFVGDEAFPLQRCLMKPYPNRIVDHAKKVFSYRLSGAHQASENAFGVLASRFKIFQATIQLEPPKVEKIVLACTALHNFLRREHASSYTPTGSLDEQSLITGFSECGSWHKDPQLMPLEIEACDNTTDEAETIRNNFTEYFMNEGSLPVDKRMCI